MMNKAGLSEKERDLRDLIRGLESVVVAFSGGVDSSLVATIAGEELKDNAVAVTATSPIFPERDREDAQKVADEIGIKHIKMESSKLENERFVSNPTQRCYYCKKGILKELDEIREDLGFKRIVDGTNKEDHEDYRPGIQALDEFGDRVISPLSETGFTKKDVRLLADKLSIPTADKPSSACLASRIPFGERITEKKLGRIEKSERFLRELGFEIVRVRDHGRVARIELDESEIPEAIGLRDEINEQLQKFGYKHVSIDLEGYRMGSLNPEKE